MPNIELALCVTDFVINNVHEYEVFELTKVLSKFDYRKYSIAVTGKEEVMLAAYTSQDSLDFMIAKGIIEPTDSRGNYRLTNFGREIKVHKGYNNYVDWVRRKDNALFENVHWTKWAAIGAIATAIFTLCALFKDCSCNHIYPKNLQTDTINRAKTKTELEIKR